MTSQRLLKLLLIIIIGYVISNVIPITDVIGLSILILINILLLIVLIITALIDKINAKYSLSKIPLYLFSIITCSSLIVGFKTLTYELKYQKAIILVTIELDKYLKNNDSLPDNLYQLHLPANEVDTSILSTFSYEADSTKKNYELKYYHNFMQMRYSNRDKRWRMEYP